MIAYLHIKLSYHLALALNRKNRSKHRSLSIYAFFTPSIDLQVLRVHAHGGQGVAGAGLWLRPSTSTASLVCALWRSDGPDGVRRVLPSEKLGIVRTPAAVLPWR
jgi:hypothetical protein